MILLHYCRISATSIRLHDAKDTSAAESVKLASSGDDHIPNPKLSSLFAKKLALNSRKAEVAKQLYKPTACGGSIAGYLSL